MKEYVKLTYALFILVISVEFSGGCARSSAKQAPKETLRIAYATLNSVALVHIALARGYLAEEGIVPLTIAFPFGKPALQALLDGKADVATAAETPFVTAVLGGKDLVALASIFSATQNQGILARRAAGIEKASQLRGKRIGVTLGTSMEYLAYVLLLDQGIESRDVELVDLPQGDLVGSFEEGKIDAVALQNPILAQLRRDMGDKTAVFFEDELYTEHFCLYSTRDFASKHPDWLKKLLGSLVKAERFVHSHEAEARGIIAGRIDVDLALLDSIWAVNSYHVSLGQSILIDFEDQARWLIRKDNSLPREVPNFLKYIDADILRHVEPGLVDLLQ